MIIVLVIILIGCENQTKEISLPSVSSGRIERIEKFPSNFIESRNVDVWLPDGYNNNEKYSVLYMHDGQMLFDSTLTWNKQAWSMDETIGRLIDENKIERSIIVGIWNISEIRHADYTPQKPFENLPVRYQDSLYEYGVRAYGGKIISKRVQSDNYLRFIVEELKPYIDKHYSTNSKKEHTFIAGSSMGGLISLYAACEYPKVFGGAACLSTHWTVIYTHKNNLIPAAIIEYLEKNLPDPASHKFYFDFGTETLDTLYEQYQMEVDKVMIEKGYSETNWTSLKFVGESHTENAWKERVHIPITFLLGK
ncbi:MAG: alpha/beta hydrolase-fold protein [Melioribacteraceae bacterium]|nr:alpha/beta hydrolase-fold protein [Melioribacteraceae bacterium]